MEGVGGKTRAALLSRYDDALMRVNACLSHGANSTLPPVDLWLNGSLQENIMRLERYIDEECVYSFDTFWPMHTRIIMTVIFAALSLIGIVGNLLVILVVFRVRGMVSRGKGMGR